MYLCPVCGLPLESNMDFVKGTILYPCAHCGWPETDWEVTDGPHDNDPAALTGRDDDLDSGSATDDS